ncbi:MAG: hypothetical protein IT229_01960 [Flavobacteriales bacterium]|nr:hypothetical protein [Flavobacteriales bacterium]
MENMEEALGFALPDDYREVMLAYPFSTEDGGHEMLINEPVISADPINLELLTPDVRQPFLIGGVLGKDVYYMDADRRSSPVFVRDLKKGLKWEFSPSLSAYVEHIKSLPQKRTLWNKGWRL